MAKIFATDLAMKAATQHKPLWFRGFPRQQSSGTLFLRRQGNPDLRGNKPGSAHCSGERAFKVKWIYKIIIAGG
jgi:hypothetical protein